MRIVFVTPASNLRRSLPFRVGFYAYGHPDAITGPLILGHILKDAGHEVEVYEELYTTPNYRKVLAGADVICLSVMTSNALRAYELVDRFRTFSDARIIMGGIHPTCCPEEALEHADQVITGEGESVILDVIEGRITDKIVEGEPVADLDSVPFPDYSILKTPCHSADVMTTRGCPYGKCTFCTSARMFTPYRERSVESVLDELRYYKQLGFRYVNFEDDNFTANKGRAKAICRGMIENNLVFGETFFFGRVDMGTDEEMLDLLERAHLTYALIGIESLNPDALAEIDKGQQPADIERCAQALSRHKIRLIASLVLGIDTDTPEDILNSVAFASRIGAYQLQPAILTPFPGTPIRAQFEQESRMITDRWSLYDMMNVVYVPKRMTPWQLQDLFFESAERFYTFSSSFDIMKRFGPSFGMRRMSLWAFSRLGGAAGRAVSKTVRQSHYYTLRHDYASEGEPVREANDGAARRQDAHATLRTVALAAAGAGVAVGIAAAKVVGDRPLAQANAKAGSFA